MMKANYSKYGDLLSFDVTDLKNLSSDGSLYRIGVFTVFDTNMRLLLAGFAIICSETSQTFYKVFQKFFEFQEKYPQTIVTDQQLTIQEGIQILKQRSSFSGNHIFDPFHVIDNIQRKLKKKKSLDKGKKQIQIVRKMIFQRQQENFFKLIRELSENISEQTTQIFDDFLNNSKKICYIDIPGNKFIGVNMLNQQKINDLVQRLAQRKTTIQLFIEKMRQLDCQLEKQSSKQLKMYREPIQEELRDPKVHQLRHTIQVKIFRRFLQNYFKGLQNVVIQQRGHDTTSEQSAFRISERSSSRIFDILDWRCSCNELGKTGIPCPHLIMAAKKTPSKGYVSLFNRRWLKDIPKVQNKHNGSNVELEEVREHTMEDNNKQIKISQ